MENKKLTLDELFEKQEVNELLFTIEPVKDDDLKIKVTPWSEESGCNCELSLIISKELIKSVTPTEQIHKCCGKRLLVVTIDFNEKASLSLDDIYSQIFNKVEHKDGHSHEHIQESYSEDLFLDSDNEQNEYYQDSGYYEDNYPVEDEQYQNIESYNDDYELGYSSSNKSVALRCPSGTVQIGCGGRFHCVRPGSSCCSGRVCAPGHRCFGCGGRFHCVRPGSSCCSGRVCAPGHRCFGCGGRFHCVRPGSSCCSGRVCAPGHRCIGCGGRFHCVRPGCRCSGGRIVC